MRAFLVACFAQQVWSGHTSLQFLAASSNTSAFSVDTIGAPPQTPLRQIGRSRYGESFSLPTWRDVAADDPHLGAICDAEAAGRGAAASADDLVTGCGTGLVCREGVCRHCLEDQECPALQLCQISIGQRICTPTRTLAWEQVFSDPYEFLCTLLIFLAAVLAAAAGAGGGGVFVPLLVLLSNVKAEASVPLSQSMVLCGSIVNLVMLMPKKHPVVPARARIDYDCVAFIVPLLCLGVTLGVLIHRIIPKWALLVLLVTVLGLSLWRTASRGFKQLADESMGVSSRRDRASAGKEEQRTLSGSFSTAAAFIAQNRDAVLVIVFVQAVMLASSFHGFPVCSWSFLLYLVMLALFLLVCTVCVRRYVVADRLTAQSEPTDSTSLWSPGGKDTMELARFPLVAFASGALGGLLGIGGGMILGPVLLEMGMHSEAVQATTAAFVFLSSSLAFIQFAVLGQHIWHYALWYGAVVAAATLLGQWVCEVAIRKYKRASVITFAISGLLAVSLVALSIVSVQQIADDVRLGRPMSFSYSPLCRSASMGIVSLDGTMATPWPSDIPKMIS